MTSPGHSSRLFREELSELLLSWLKQVPASGTAQPISVATMASVMSWAMFGTAVQWSRGTRTTTKEQVVNQVLIVLTEGVARLTPGLLLE